MIVSTDISELVHVGESLTLEYKSSFDRELIETLVAFANASGGTLLVGVTDDGAIWGVKLGKETLNEWLGKVKSSTSPSIIPDIEAFDIDGRTVVAIHIGEYPIKPINTRGKYFRRFASSNHQLSLNEITDLYMQSLQLSWDAYEAPREDLNSLSVRKIEQFIDQVNQCDRFTLDKSPLLALEKLKYVVNNHPTWASMLLFADNPLRHHIHIGRLKTPTIIIDDRITIFSPGKLYGGLTIEEIKSDSYQSHIRNKLIAEAFYLTKNIEKYGSGFIRIRKELEEYPEVSFDVEEIGGGVLVTFSIFPSNSGGVNEGVSERT